MTEIILTSTGISDEAPYHFFKKLVQDKQLKKAGIIANAHPEGAEGYYVQIAKRQLEDLGFSVVFLNPLEDTFKTDISRIDTLYLAGGNTFNLLDDIKTGVGLEVFKRFITKLRAIVGVSAGSIILTPTIRIAGAIEPDDNPRGIKTLDALNVVESEYLPHYDEELESAVKTYEEGYDVSVIRSKNGDFTHLTI